MPYIYQRAKVVAISLRTSRETEEYFDFMFGTSKSGRSEREVALHKICNNECVDHTKMWHGLKASNHVRTVHCAIEAPEGNRTEVYGWS